MFQEISKSDLSRLKNIVTTTQDSTRYSGVIRTFHTEFNIGVLNNNMLNLSAMDKIKIKKIILSDVGIDLTKPLPKSRMDMAKYNSNEKLASENPRDNHVSVRSVNGNLYINNEKYSIPKKSFLVFDKDDIKSVEHRYIIIIENLVPFQVIEENILPSILNNSLLIYRGDGVSNKSTMELVNKLDNKVILFTDADPAGVIIAKTYPRVSKLLIPDISDSLFSDLGNDAKYYNQISNKKESSYLNISKSNREFESYVKQIDRTKTGVQQEHMLAKKIDFKLINIK